MGRHGVRLVVTVALAALMVASQATLAFAPHVARVEVEPATVSPGDDLSVFGPNGYGSSSDVDIHWNEPDGELLGTFETGEGFFAPFGPVEVTIPDDAASGQHLIVVTQQLEEGERHIRGLPAYAQVQVVGGAEPAEGDDAAAAATDPAGEVERVATLSEADTPGVGLLVLVGAATLAVALAVAAIVARSLRRATPGSATEPADS